MSLKNFSEGSYIESVGSPQVNNPGRERSSLKKDFIKLEKKKLPSKRQMAANLTKSLSKSAKALVSGKKIKAELSLIEKRTAICHGCAWFIKENQRCSKCGCVVPLKVYLAEETCPVEKW
tara:strand:- start:186 stop:545 length:360 start_codon:yes stop_codon:yes gene_type:complete